MLLSILPIYILLGSVRNSKRTEGIVAENPVVSFTHSFLRTGAYVFACNMRDLSIFVNLSLKPVYLTCPMLAP
jgi:hypothetical protein